MSKHNYTNPAFCQNSEYYPVPSADRSVSNANAVEAIYNRSLNLNFTAAASTRASASACRNPRDGPLRIQRSISTRSFVAQTSTTRKPAAAAVHINRQLQMQQYQHFQQQQHHQNQQHHQKQQQQQQRTTYHDTTLPSRAHQTTVQRPVNLNHTADEPFESSRSGSGRYALVPVEELSRSGNNRYAIVPGPPALASVKRYAKSQDNLDRYGSHGRLQSDEEPHSFHEEPAQQYTSLPPVFDEPPRQSKRPNAAPPNPAKIKHAFSSDFGSKSFLIVDKNSNQRYQMVPTAEDEELVDDNQEIIQMHNGRAHRYAVIPTEGDDDDDDGHGIGNDEDEEEETCLSTSELNQSQNFLPLNYEHARTPLRTSTPQKGVSMANLSSYPPTTPLKNPAATKMLHELLSTPRKTPMSRSAQTTPRNAYHMEQLQTNERRVLQSHHSEQAQIYYAPTERKMELSPQRLHYETVKPALIAADRSTAVITPRLAGSKVYPQVVEECSSIHEKSNNNDNTTSNSYPQKVANATITLAVVSLMLVLGSTMNSALIIYMIAHFGKSFYLQFSLVAAFCGVGLGFLGFRSRQCEWLPNRSYTSGYILVTMFCLLKCCGLLLILVLDPYPGLPLHDVTTGVILGLSTFTMFFIGLGVIGSLWCYRPPPDNRVNVV